MAIPTPKTYSGTETNAMDGGASQTDAKLNIDHVESGQSGSTLKNKYFQHLQQIHDLIAYSLHYSGFCVQEDSDTVGFFPCKYSIAGSDYSYAGATGVTPGASQTTLYWLTTSSTLGSGTSWPGTEVHRLAEVTTSGTTITSVINVWPLNAGRGAASSWSSFAATANPDIDGYDLLDVGILNFDAASELTISSGAVTATNGVHTIDTESDASSDDLDTISGGTAGDFLILAPENAARVVTVKDGSGNIKLADGDYAMSADDYYVMLYFDGSNWIEVSRSHVSPTSLTADLDAGGYDINNIGIINLDAMAELTISSGAITATQTAHRIDTESDASTDDLDTISGGTEGDTIILRAENASRTVVVKHGTGNVNLANGKDYTMDDKEKFLVLYYDSDSVWHEIARGYQDVADMEDTSKAIPIVYTFVVSGSLSAGVISLKYLLPSEYDVEFVNAIGNVGTAPSGGACIVDVQDDAASLFANSGEMINIADGTTSDVSATKNSTIAGGSVLSIEIKSDSGSPNSAANLTVVVNLRAPVKLGS